MYSTLDIVSMLRDVADKVEDIENSGIWTDDNRDDVISTIEHIASEVRR